MGSSLSYVAIKAKEKKRDEILACFSLKEAVGVHSQSFIQGVATSKGWYLLIADSSGVVLEKETLAELSKSYDVVCGQANEHNNSCFATGWSGGEVVWSVSHELERGAADLREKGKPPRQFASLKKKIEQERIDTQPKKRWDHYFEIPVALFESLVGYRYDRTTDSCNLDTAVPLVLVANRGKKDARSSQAESLARMRQFPREIEKSVANAIEFAKEGEKDYSHSFNETEGVKPLIEGVVRLGSTEMRYTLRPNKISVQIDSLLPELESVFTDSTAQHYTYKVRKGSWEPYNYSLSDIASERVTKLGDMNDFYNHVAAGGTFQFMITGQGFPLSQDD